MKIGIIGLGIVGRAVMEGLQQINQEVSYYDIKIPETSIQDILNTEIVFICVPTNSTAEGKCDISIVELVVKQLIENYYKGIIAIKSTVIPGTTQNLINKYKNKNICFVPEFLRQRCALSDFHDHHDVLVIGTQNNEVYERIKESHRSIPKNVIQVSPTEAEVVKYFNNVHNSMEIVFANAVYEMTKLLGANYQNVFDAVTLRENINPSYLRCSEHFRGFGGACLPKDSVAWALLAKELGVNVKLFDAIIDDNKRYI